LGLRTALRHAITTQPDRHPSPSFGANFGDRGFNPQTEYRISANFSPSLENAIHLDGESGVPDAVYRKQPAVRICVDFLALNIAHLNLKTYRRGANAEREPASDSPLAALIQRPNPRTTRFDLIRATVADFALYENAFWLKAREGDARRLYRIPPYCVTVKGGNILTGPESYELNTNGTPQPFSPDQIIHFTGYHPTETRYGQSRLHALRMVLREEAEASRFRGKFWSKGARMDLVLKRPISAGKWSEEAFKRFREGWRQFSRGGSLEGDTAVLEDDMDVKEVSFSPKDAEFIAGREWALDVVATAYQIPLAMLSRTKSPTYASMKEFHKVLYVDVLGPWNAMIESTLAAQLVPEFDDPDLYVEFNIDEKLQGDFESQAQAARQSVQVPWMSVDEMRAKRGEPPYGGVYARPARPKNYLYGDEEPETEPAAALQVVENAATNGHKDEVGAELERLLEVP
jgi:HK97 family phage portal protein